MTADSTTFAEQARVLQNRITDEIFFALGLPRQGVVRRALGALFRKPAERFGQIAARFESEVRRAGLGAGACSVMRDFRLTADACGIERIPPRGPLLILSNHPGAYDSVVITSCIPRADLKLVVSDVPFTRALEAASDHFIYVSTNTLERMNALRQAVEHLKGGGAILLFASGEVEPDPAFMSGAAETMHTWSRSIEVMLRKAPETRLQVAIASGVLLPRFVNNLLTRIRRMPYHRQKMGELLQILQQLLFPEKVAPIAVRVSFGESVEARELGDRNLMPGVIQRAKGELERHREIFDEYE